ncbi:MAG: multicopper oxidase domain-containing protein [Phycisphaerae bacterium]|nr:multicopper oxidase domain-containing protein [Gemmatimonadaceae bacterium]
MSHLRFVALILPASLIASFTGPEFASSNATCAHLPGAPKGVAAANDNRISAGTVVGSTLNVRLEMRAVAWRPDGAKGCALPVNAFGEVGKTTQIPGPLIRVRAGTTVNVSIRNTLPKTVWVRGLQDRGPGVLDSAAIDAGASRSFRFVANVPGAWYYWAGDAAARIPASGANGQLVGALIVDSATTAMRQPVRDRVLVISRWNPAGTTGNNGFQLNALNGRSWPNTEKLMYTEGDSVRWHVINASNELHEMHLHGFYFRVAARGLAIRDSVVPPDRALLVTGVLRPGEWSSIAWTPDRPGNWLYHCHLLSHMSGAQRLNRMTATAAAEDAHAHAAETSKRGNHAMDDMGGLVVALDIRASKNASARARTSAPSTNTRSIDLYANSRAGTFGSAPGFGFIVQDGSEPPARDSVRIPGSLLILKRGETVRIAVHNRLAQPLSVHWHGLELDSYYDGVGGFSGDRARIAPMIAPNNSFSVQITPPRVGTFMYHVHGERGSELASGLYGPLLVLDHDSTFDADRDRIFVMADGGPGTETTPFVNGTARPDTMDMVVGTTYRLRIISIANDDSFVTTMRGPGAPPTWRVMARDGAALPDGPSAPAAARYVGGPGHTRDVAFTPGTAGDYTMEVVRTRLGSTLGPITRVPIRVRAP